MVTKRSTTAALKRLRALMKDAKFVSEKLNAYIVTSGDAHQSEYIAQCDKRREFISGFTGSRGLACITERSAALWTDGRYFLQAERELDENWTLMKEGLPETPTVVDWLVKSVPQNGRVGVDPHLITIDQFKDWAKKLKKNGVTLVPDAQNLVDIVWGDARPMPPSGSLFVLPIEFAGRSVAEKLDDIRRQMRDQNAALLVLSELDEVAWLFNLRGSDIPYCPVFIAYAIIGINFASLFVDLAKVTPAVKEHLKSGGKSHQVDIFPYEEVKEHLENHRKKDASGKIWLSADGSSMAFLDLIPEDRWLDKLSPVATAKAVKNGIELQGMRNAHIKDAVAHCEMSRWLEEEIGRKDRKDISETVAAEKFTEFRREQEDFIDLSFETISAVGPNSAKPHYKPPSVSEVKAGHPVGMLSKQTIYLVDSGAQFRDGTTDVTRTMIFSEPTAYQKECYTRVLKGHIALALIKFPDNTSGLRLDSLARVPLWQVGLDYQHGTGHGVGHFLNVHEGPAGFSIRMDKTAGLRENMIMTIEPGFYKEDDFGIRIENCYAIIQCETKHKFNNMKFLTFDPITLVPIQTRLIEPTLLSAAEVEWLNDYHALVLEKLTPTLEKQNRLETLKWLRQQTQPLG